MRLQSDPTFLYGVYGGERQTERQADHPVRHRQRHALQHLQDQGSAARSDRQSRPAALEAVAHPAEPDDLYFVADGTGGHVFSSSLDEHNRNVENYRNLQRQEARDAEATQAAAVFRRGDEERVGMPVQSMTGFARFETTIGRVCAASGNCARSTARASIAPASAAGLRGARAGGQAARRRGLHPRQHPGRPAVSPGEDAAALHRQRGDAAADAGAVQPSVADGLRARPRPTASSPSRASSTSASVRTTRSAARRASGRSPMPSARRSTAEPRCAMPRARRSIVVLSARLDAIAASSARGGRSVAERRGHPRASARAGRRS